MELQIDWQRRGIEYRIGLVDVALNDPSGTDSKHIDLVQYDDKLSFILDLEMADRRGSNFNYSPGRRVNMNLVLCDLNEKVAQTSGRAFIEKLLQVLRRDLDFYVSRFRDLRVEGFAKQ